MSTNNMRAPLRITQDSTGNVWFIVNNKTMLYMSNDGSLHVQGDVICFTQLPDPPP